MSQTTVSALKAARTRSAHDGDVLEALGNSTRAASQILAARGLGLRISLGSNWTILGDRSAFSSAADGVEFEFATAAKLKKTFDRMRLINFAMAYIDGHMKVHGPISKAVDILDAINSSTDRRRTVGERLKGFVFRLSKVLLPASFMRFESLDHYANSAKAYELFLDTYLQYTCGRFETGTEDINTAQIAKFELIKSTAEKYLGSLRNKELLDIGCGWGGMMAYFEREYGMRSVGNTNTLQQKKYAEQRFGSEIIFGDFMELSKLDKKFDLLTVIGMIEHLTPYRRSQLLEMCRERLKESGVLYLQSITKPSVWIGGDAYRMTQKEVFPGHYLETDQETEKRLRNCGFEILERFDHGKDYGFTTARWAERVQENEAALTSLLGARQYRVYLGYLAYASKLFSTGRGNLMRYVVRKI